MSKATASGLAFVAGVTAGVSAQGGESSSPVVIRELRCEYRVNPLGIDEPRPRLTWLAESPERGGRQTAYQVLVASEPAKLAADQGDLWDSGKVNSDQSHLVVYEGRPQGSLQRCHWKVRLWDQAGRVTAWSEPARWSMGLLEPADWKGKWIGKEEPVWNADAELAILQDCSWIWYPEGNPAVEAPVVQRYLRRQVTLPEDRTVQRVTFYLTGDNGFTLFFNGKWLGMGSNYHQVCQLDGTAHVRPGDNLIAVAAANHGTAPNPAGLIGFARFEFETGEPLIIRTDADWIASNAEIPGWEQPGHDTSSWSPALVMGRAGMAPWGELGIAAPDDRPLPARYLRRDFSLDKPIASATATICGLGYYELYLNGRKVGDHVLDPGLTDYTKRALYVTYDVADLLQSGANAVGVILGNGRYYAPRLSFPFQTTDYGTPRLLMQLDITYADGSTSRVVSDKSWKLTADGPIRANNDYDGEVYDARLADDAWCKPGFDDAAWSAAQLVEAPGGALTAQMAEPHRVTETLKPVALTQPKPGVYVFDLGQNMVGWARLTLSAPAGTRIQMRFAESLDKDGMIYTANLRSARCADVYICNGRGTESYEPRFTYHGFQFIELTGYPGEPRMDTLVGRVVHSDLETMGDFTCSHPLLNRIHRNIRWGIRGNVRSVPTDCPQRDERHGWLGDIANEAKSESYEFNVAPFFAKWLRDIRDAQTAEGNLPDVAPPYWVMYTNNMTWPAAYIIIPGWYYEQYGDLRLLAEHYPAMGRFLDYMSQFLQDDLMPRDTYGDWCVPPESPELIHSNDPARKTAGPYLGSAYYAYLLRRVADYAVLLDKPDDARRFTERAERITAAFNARYLDRDKALYDNGTQTAQVLALAFDLAPPDVREQVFAALVHNIVETNRGHLATGLVGGQWLMRTLTRFGRPDVAYTIATQTAYPSWGYMVEQGATTIWELWNGNTADPAMNSRNHLMLVGDLGLWFTEHLAGLKSDPRQPAFKHVICRPTPVGDLTAASAWHQSMHGRAASSWRIEGGKFLWEVTVPFNTTATVYVPTADPAAVFETGRPAAEAPGVTVLPAEPGHAVFQLAAGTYSFAAPAPSGR